MQRTNSPRRQRLMYQRLASARSRHFERRTERKSISMRRSSWIPVRLLVALLLRCRHHGRRTDQCRMGHRLLQSLTDGSGGNRETLKLFICRPSSRFRVLGPSSGWIPPSCNGPTTRSSALVTCGRRLEDVVTDLRLGILLPSELRMIKIVHWESKWYSRNNRRLWCFREAVVIVVQVRVGSTNRALLRGLITYTDGLYVIFFPALCVQGVRQGVVNHKKSHNHDRQKKVDSAAPPARENARAS